MRTRYKVIQRREENQIYGLELQEKEESGLGVRGEPGSDKGLRGQRKTRFKVGSKRREKIQAQGQEMEEREQPGSGLVRGGM